MKRSIWSLAVVALAFSGLAMVGGTTIGGDLGPLMTGYGLLLALAALYMAAGLAIRDRVWQRHDRRQRPMVPKADRLAGRRVF